MYLVVECSSAGNKAKCCELLLKVGADSAAQDGDISIDRHKAAFIEITFFVQ